ncbi:MAG: hypothetical protein IJH39_05845 [Clostridia bacterium]|nr:hypothetical protein [Clostridia bacterium]
MKITTKLLDTNNTKYQYAEGVLDEAINEYMKREYKFVSNKVGSTELNYVIGKVENIEKTDTGEILANIELLDTFEGRIYQELIKQQPINFGISGYGNINDDGVIENLNIKDISVISCNRNLE